MKAIQMKINHLYCLILILFSSAGYAQININGKVVNGADDTPLTNASVYFNNTILGTYTDDQGYFSFETIRLINTEMVVSCPGYELMVYKPNAAEIDGKRIVFKLKRAEKATASPLKLSDIMRKRYLDVFKQFFLGVTEEAVKCTIGNEEDIYFTEGENREVINAHADIPLIINNVMLGYKVKVDLVDFWFDNVTGQNYILAYLRYDDLGANKKIIKNRQNCYLGSSMHFFRSLVTHQLYQEGFGTFYLHPLKDSSAEALQKDNLVMQGLDTMVVDPITAQEILFIDSSNNLSIGMQGKLVVQYAKETTIQKYFLFNNMYMNGFLPKGVESYILFKTPFIGINNAGVLSDTTNIEYDGYWSYERVANMLPFDYNPDSKITGKQPAR